MSPDLFFWPVIVVLSVVVIAVSARFVFRIALFFISLFILWYLLFLVGLVPSPIGYFHEVQPPQELLRSQWVR